MAEIIDNTGHSHDVPTQCKTNAALTTGIIGTALGVIGIGTMHGLMNNLRNNWAYGRCGGFDGYDGYGRGGCGNFNGWNGYVNGYGARMNDGCINAEELHLERKNYEDKLENQRELSTAFFDAYKRDIDNSFELYKNQRDGFDLLNQKMIDSSFGLYKNQRDEKDALNEKIGELKAKIDVMAAIRPYQDALINAKIDNNALMSDYKLCKRTCRMIEGKLVLPNTPVVEGYGSADNLGI